MVGAVFVVVMECFFTVQGQSHGERVSTVQLTNTPTARPIAAIMSQGEQACFFLYRFNTNQ